MVSVQRATIALWMHVALASFIKFLTANNCPIGWKHLLNLILGLLTWNQKHYETREKVH